MAYGTAKPVPSNGGVEGATGREMDLRYGSVEWCQTLQYRRLDLRPPELRECDKVLLLVKDAEGALVEVVVLDEQSSPHCGFLCGVNLVETGVARNRYRRFPR
ncbi:hypothetical protein B0H13DRAFT_2381990 [Mycena leptocephala]|nr:hypothetical protein B0H13DRAFT_2381990 [Mycena leptocephala]